RNGQRPIAFAVSRDVSRRGELRGFFVQAALVRRFCLSPLWRAAHGGAEESRSHMRMPRLRATDFGHGGNGDASVQAAADDVVLGGASHGDPFQRHVGATIGGSTRRHLQDRLALSRSRILLVNAAVRSRTALRKINHLGPSTSARNPPKMVYSWRVRQCLADVRRMLRLLRNERT